MEYFLEKIAKEVYSTFGNKLHEVCIVLPNKRASLFLKKHLAKLIDKPIWLPSIYGTEDFIQELSNSKIPDQITLLFEFYLSYQKITDKKEIEIFDEFCKWGTIALQDFNEIDRYMIEIESFFSYINETRALEVWNLGEGELSDFQKKYIHFWQKLHLLYQQFKKDLDQKNYAYQGHAFRTVAERLVQGDELTMISINRWKHIVFAGFNALTTAEETIIRTLLKEQKASVYWDTDAYYQNNTIQEAGIFTRRYEKWEETDFRWKTDELIKGTKKIQLIGVAQNIGQVKIAGDLLSQIEQSNFQNTAVVLADENLLIPCLQSLSDNVGSVNITMGYSLQQTPFYSFIDNFIRLYINAERFGNKGEIRFYFKDIKGLLSHGFIQRLNSEIKDEVQKLVAQIEEHNLIFLSATELNSISTPALNIFFDESLKLPELMLNRLIKIIHLSLTTIDHNSDPLETEQLFHISKGINQLKDYIKNYSVISKNGTLHSIFKQVIAKESIPFYGEPLSGLQLMGMLETRTLDFENLILLSANEGILPAGKTQNSFIPNSIKRSFKLPTYIEKDAIFAYHFYRLLQRAKNVFLLYNTEKDSFGSGEKSRFLTQLVHELPKVNPNVEISSYLSSTPLPSTHRANFKIISDQGIQTQITNHLKRGLSPSALNTYIRCPLDYYYKYVLRLKPQEEVEETIEANTMGSIIHSILEDLYKPYEGMILDQVFRERNFTKEIYAFADKHYYELYSKSALSGKNLISREVTISYIQDFIKLDQNRIQVSQEIKIEGLELELELETELKHQSLCLKGVVDRLETENGIPHLIDYKTGLVKDTDLKVKELESIFESKYEKALQLLFYAFLYHKKFNVPVLKASILSFKKLSGGFLSLTIDGSELLDKTIFERFELLLMNKITEILQTKEFEHNIDSKYCEFCD